MPSTADTLLAAVRADPDADLPRLVYADALDDAGQPERAEFVRVQCELANLDEWDARRPALEDREHELLDRHEAAWLGDLWQLDEWEWRRGFVDEVSGHYRAIWHLGQDGFAGHPVGRASVTTWRTGPNWPEGMPPGSWLAGLSYLSLADTESFPALLRQLLRSPHLAGLTGLDVSGNPPLAELADVLADASFLDGLRELSAGGPDHPGPNSTGGLDARRLAGVLSASPLARLRVPNCGIGWDGVGHLLAARFGPELVEFDVSDNPLRYSESITFDRLPVDAKLSRLDVSGTAAADIQLAGYLARSGLQRLTRLDANRSRAVGMTCGVIAQTPHWPRLTGLRLHSCGLMPEALAMLAVVPGPADIRLLDLADNSLGPPGVARLVAARWGGSLTWLALSRNGLDDMAVGALVAGGKFKHLRTLHLAFNVLTDITAAILANAPSLAYLRILTLSQSQLTSAGVMLLLESSNWSLAGLGVSDCDLSAGLALRLATSPRLRRLQWLDLSTNPRLGGDALMPLAESPHLSRLCELDIGGCDASDRVRDALRERLGRRLSD